MTVAQISAPGVRHEKVHASTLKNILNSMYLTFVKPNYKKALISFRKSYLLSVTSFPCTSWLDISD